MRGRVILATALDPVSRLFDVDLPTRVVVPEGHWRYDGHQVMLVINVCDVSGKLSVDEVGPRSITDARQAISDKLDGDSSGQLDTEEDTI